MKIVFQICVYTAYLFLKVCTEVSWDFFQNNPGKARSAGARDDTRLAMS
jgi:hypothetical protein